MSGSLNADERRRLFQSRDSSSENSDLLAVPEEKSNNVAFPLVLLGLQGLFLVFFSVFFSFPSSAELSASLERYPFFRDVALMILVGFGFLMAFLRRHRFGSLTYTLLVTMLCMQWGVITNAMFLHYALSLGHHGRFVTLSMTSLINGMFTAGAVLISFGAWIGKVNGQQLTFMVLFECIFQSLNNFICTYQLDSTDIGGSIVIHMFGAYFGLAATLLLSPPSEDMVKRAQFANSSYDSDTFSLMATFFLFIYWPSFNAATAPLPELQALSVLNTVIAIVGSGFTALAASRLLRQSDHWTLEDLQNSVLAGGVAIGSSAAWNTQPGVALAFGIVSGFISVLGYAKIGPWLQEKIQTPNLAWFDTAGIHNLHGMPSLIGGFGSAIVFAFATDITTPWQHQIYASLVTLGVAIVTGAFSGLLCRKLIQGPKKLFNDAENFEMSSLCNADTEISSHGTRSTLLDLSMHIKQRRTQNLIQ